MTIPNDFLETILSVFGDRGQAWLDGLPALSEECCKRWSLSVGPPFQLSYNYVVPATRSDGAEFVLKLGVPGKELLSEITALAAYDGRGSVRLIDSDAERGILLLERLSPGSMLSEVGDDDRMTHIAAAVFRKLRCPAPAGHAFPSVADWANGLRRLRDRYDGGTGPFPTRLVEEAEALFSDLLASLGPPVLLHGDLHHFNILQHGDSWLAIDPKGVIGEAEYEVGALLRNPNPALLARPEATALQKRRIQILEEELGYDRQRLRDWAVAQSVLSGWWTVEDHGEVSDTWIACCERLAEVRF